MFPRKPAAHQAQPEPGESPVSFSRRAAFEAICIGEYTRAGLLENEAVDLIEAGVSVGAFFTLVRRGCDPHVAARILL